MVLKKPTPCYTANKTKGIFVIQEPEKRLSARDLLIKVQPTPNPWALKFIINTPLKLKGKATFLDRSECESLPLVRDLLLVPGVKQVYLFENTLSITHSGELEEEDLKQNICSVLRTRIEVHDPNFDSEGSQSLGASTFKPKKHTDPAILEIESILDRTIRPGLQADGGDLQIVDFKNNELIIFYEGACGGCPSATMGTLDAIENILRYELQNDQLIVSVADL